MHHVAIILLLFFLLFPSSTFFANSLEHDKYLHFSIGFSLSITSNYFFGFHGDILAFGIGIFKEVYDYYDEDGVADLEDIYSDLIGVLSAKIYIKTFDRKPLIGFCLFF
ncbi:MAG: hypothetical protein U9O65_03805 [Thermotogota bacterium]|nr:hypothetical protein [Thermotogota bacterium]